MTQREIAYHYACHVDAGIGFHTSRTGAFSFFPPESVTFDYEGYEIQWNEWGSDHYVTVTLVSREEIDPDDAHGVLLRFISALAFTTEAPVRFISFGGGMPAPPDRRVAILHSRALASARSSAHIHLPEPHADPIAARAVAFWRLGKGETTPWHAFLSFWKALECVFADDTSKMAKWLNSQSPTGDPGFFKSLKDTFRDAVGHGYRTQGSRAVASPDEPSDWERFDEPSRQLGGLSRLAILETWPKLEVPFRLKGDALERDEAEEREEVARLTQAAERLIKQGELTPRVWQVIRSRYGLGERALSFEEIAEKVGDRKVYLDPIAGQEILARLHYSGLEEAPWELQDLDA